MSLEDAQARIESRLAERRARAQTLLARDPLLLALAESCKSTFDARLRYLKVGEDEIGSSVVDGDDLMRPGIVPARYNKPPRGKGRVAWLRGLEAQA